MSNQRKDNDSGMGCVLVLILAVVAMPLVGLYLAAAGEDDGQKLLGVALLIVGIIVWIKMGVGGVRKRLLQKKDYRGKIY